MTRQAFTPRLTLFLFLSNRVKVLIFFIFWLIMSPRNWKLSLMKKIIRSECIVYYCVFIGAGSLELIPKAVCSGLVSSRCWVSVVTDGMLLGTGGCNWLWGMLPSLWASGCRWCGSCLLCCPCPASLLDAGWGVSAKIAQSQECCQLLEVLTAGLCYAWIGHLYCTTDGDCQAEYVMRIIGVMI